MRSNNRVRALHPPSAPVPAVPGDALRVLVHARALLTEAKGCDDPAERFRLAHLGALRTTAVVFATRPVAGRRRLVNAWALLAATVPEWSGWAHYFAAGAATRAAVEAGARGVVGGPEADEQLRAATAFLEEVEISIGVLSPALAS